MEQSYIDLLLIVATQFVPILAAFVEDQEDKSTRKIHVSILASVALATLRAFTSGEYDPAVLGGTAVAAFMAQLSAYRGIWKPWKLNERAQVFRFPQHQYHGE